VLEKERGEGERFKKTEREGVCLKIREGGGREIQINIER